MTKISEYGVEWTYVYCGQYRTQYAIDVVGPLCPQCNVPFTQWFGVAKEPPWYRISEMKQKRDNDTSM